MAFESDFDWQRGYLTAVKQIIGGYLIGEAPLEEDMTRNTDLIVLKLDAVRIACRIRRHDYLANYGDEFTIRSSRPNGTMTELAKMISGWGQYLFYGFAEEAGPHLEAWLLADLNVFRLHHMRELSCGRMPGIEKPNQDGSSNFRAYRIAEFPPEFVVARKRSEATINWTLESFDFGAA